MRGVKGTAAPHGTKSRYTNQKCRCKLCSAANTRDQLKWRRQIGVRPLEVYLEEVSGPRVGHGTETRYKRHGCRCAECRSASAAARRRRRAKAAA
jgi:hypothetical protein